MLKWAKTIDWLAINSSALVLLVVLQLLSAFPPQPVKNPNQQSYAYAGKQPKQTETGFNWGFWEALFTGLIAVYAVRQYAESRRSAERQLRAWVFVENCVLSKDPNWDASPWEIHLQIKNYGPTPAIPSVHMVERDIRAPIGDDDILVFSTNVQESIPPAIPPGHFFTVRAPIASAAQYGRAKAAKENIYIWGRLDYVDIFGHARWLTFQMEHALDNTNEFSFCDKGNGADDDRSA